MDYAEAARLAQVWVDIFSHGQGVILEKETLSRPYGFVFFWDGREYARTGRNGFIGNTPILIDHHGDLKVLGAMRPIEEQLAKYEATLPPGRMKEVPKPPWR